MSAIRSLRFAIYLRATPQQVRAVLSDPALMPRWLAGTQFHTDAEEDPQRLSCEWLQTDHLDANGGSVSVVRFEFVAMGQVTRLTVIHRDLSVRRFLPQGGRGGLADDPVEPQEPDRDR